MTWESFKSRGFDGDEVGVVAVFESVVLVLLIFVGVFVLDEDVEDLSVDGLAGTENENKHSLRSRE